MMEILAMAAGYNTTRSQMRWDYIIQQNESKAYWDEQRQGLMASFHEATVGGNPKEKADAIDAIRKFNKSLPDYAKGQAIGPDTLEKSYETRERTRAGREMGIPPQLKDVPLTREIQKAFPEATIDVRRR
jgi:hypothetical protein